MPENPLPSRTGTTDELCTRFREALGRGERPRIEDWLASTELSVETALPKLAEAELDHRVRAGESVSAADYFARFPQLKADHDTACSLVVAEYRAARSRDRDVTPDTFRARYPDLAGALTDESWGTVAQLLSTPFTASPVAPARHRPFSPDDPTAFLLDLLGPPERPEDIGSLDKYHIQRVLGQGGMGVVLRGEDAELLRAVAIKLMRPEVAANPAARERFLREARAMAAVEHPRVAVIHQIGEWRGTPFLVMPLMRGCSLGQRLKGGPPIPLADAIRFAREAAEGLAAAHARGLVHRDVKPDNIWLEETADGVHVRLLDFGLVRDGAAEPVTQTGTVFGTPSYMAPEQANGERVDGRADLFSLGCVLFELTTGEKAFRGASVTAILFALANHVPPEPRALNPAVPEPLSKLIQQLLSKAREERPASAAEVAAILKASETEPAPLEASAPPKSDAPKQPGRRIWMVGAVAVACILALVIRMPFSGTRSPATPSGDPIGAPPPVADAEPLRVKSLDVKHFENTDAGDVPRGVLGQTSFAPLLGDRVQVVAKLSRPAYAYIIAFRPDGEAELCFPDTGDTVPQPTDAPRYPAADSVRAYGLREGTGLWVFAVVASEKPLPAYKQWLADKKLAWKPEAAPTGSVWWYDGSDLETLVEGSSTKRGKDETLAGPAASVRALGRWLERSAGAKIGVIGFGVGPRN